MVSAMRFMVPAKGSWSLALGFMPHLTKTLHVTFSTFELACFITLKHTVF